MPVATETTSLGEWVAAAEDWLSARFPPRRHAASRQPAWGVGSDSVAVFHNLPEDEERRLLAEASAWQREKFDAGYGAISWPAEVGGVGLSRQHERAFNQMERRFEVPPSNELLAVTVGLIARTIHQFGTPDQQHSWIPALLRCDELACQLFSEPDAGSDLAAVRTTARRDGEGWRIDGQKVWTSGAHHADWGMLLARTNPTAARHAGITAFMVPLGRTGVEVRPLRQMTGGSSFNEVYLNGVELEDDLRLGAVDDGWSVATTALRYERAHAGDGTGRVGGQFDQVRAAAAAFGFDRDPVTRQRLAALYTSARILSWTARRAATGAAQGVPGPEASIGKLVWTQMMSDTSTTVSRILGPRLVAETGEWGTYAWTEHLLGAPGYRIAGGSDEIQRNVIAERVLGLPREPAV